MPTLDGIHYTDSGTGTAPIVLVHGFTCDHTDWESQTAHLAKKHRVVALDLPGHGDSRDGEPSISAHGAAVATLVHQLELENAILVGHSMGCRIILEASSNCADRAAALIFVDGSRSAATPSDYESLKQRIDGVDFADFGAALFGQMFSDKTDSATRERVIARCAAMDSAWAAQLFINMGYWDAHEFHKILATSELPMLVMQTTTIENAGTRTTLTPGAATAFTDYLKSMFNNSKSQIQVLANTGHFPQFEEPDQLNAMIDQFIETVS